MKKILKTSLILSSILLIFTGCSNKENKQSNNIENQTQDNNKPSENTEKKDTVLVKNYVISEEGSMIDVEVEYKNNIAQKMTQLFVNKPISELTQNEKFKFDDVIESTQSTEAKEKIIEESKGLKLIAKEENNNLTIKAILDLNEISESDAKNALGNFDGSLDDARKIDNFEKILANNGVVEKNNKLIAEGTIDLNTIPEEDDKIRIGEFNTSFDEARKIENFEKILAERGLTEKK